MNEQMIRKNNMKLFPIYKMFAWDLLFHFSIIYLFLTQVKGLSASQVLLADSFYAFFCILFQIPCVSLIDLIGKKKAILLGNILATISVVLLAVGNSFSLLIFIYLIQAIGYILKGICEPTILSDSIPNSSISPKIFSKIDGKGTSYYFIFDAISSVVTGFLYVINPYIPMILCIICCIISTVLSLEFNDIAPSNKSKESNNLKSQFKDTLSIYKNIAKSNRLKCLLINALLFWGIITVFKTLRSSVLVDLNIPEQYFGIIIAIIQILSAISAKKQEWFHKKLKNRALTFFSISITSSFIISGLLIICNISYSTSVISCFLMFFLVGIIKGSYIPLISKYLNSFSNSNANTKIFSVKTSLENMGRVIISLLASFLLGITSTSYTLIIIGCIFFVIFIFLLDYMKTKVGLKPNEYPEEDLIFSNEEK